MNTINLNRLTSGAKGLCLGDPVAGYLNVIPGAANTAAGILAEIAARDLPALPVPCWWVSTTDGSIWQHGAASTPAVSTDWTPFAGTLSGLTATAAELNALHNSGVVASDLTTLALLQTGSALMQALPYTNVPTAALQAGPVVLVLPVVGSQITPYNLALTPVGAISGTGVTGLKLQDGNGTPVVVATTTGLTTAPLYEFSTGVTLGAGFRAPLTVSKGLYLAVSGTAANFTCTGGVNVTLRFSII